jgi:hypothetical protein
VRRFHPFATHNGFDPNNALGQGARYRSMQRDLAEADSLFLRGPKDRDVDWFGQGLGGEQCGWRPEAIASTISGARNPGRINRLT